MKIKSSKYFNTKLKKLFRKNKGLSDKIDQKLQLLSSNPRHPSLRLHKVNASSPMWSISVNMSLRILLVYRSYGILLIDIGSHDEVY